MFRGDLQRLYSRTRIREQKFEYCWSLGTADALPAPPRGVQPNPFRRAHDSGAGNMVVLGQVTKKYVLPLGEDKRAELFVSEDETSLVAVQINDLKHDRSVGVKILDWSTAPIPAARFETGSDWICDQTEYLDNGAEHLAKWDLLQVFFPPVSEEDEELHGSFEPLSPSGQPQIDPFSSVAPFESSRRLVSV